MAELEGEPHLRTCLPSCVAAACGTASPGNIDLASLAGSKTVSGHTHTHTHTQQEDHDDLHSTLIILLYLQFFKASFRRLTQ